MTPRRTEHCWPVAHSLDDLLDVIPDPATYNPEEGAFIQRFMLEPVRNQFIRAIADRFEAAGWGLIYLVNNNWRGEEILDVIPTAQTICVRHGWQKRVEIAKERNQEMGLKSLVVTEVLNNVGVGYVRLPASVTSLGTARCSVCDLPAFLSWNRALALPFWSCYHVEKQFQRTAATSYQAHGKGPHRLAGRTPSHPQSPWSHEEEQKARQLRDQGLTYRQVGERLGRSCGSVEQFLSVRGGMAGTAARQKARALLADDGF
jgi:hypothetical protein